MFGTFIGGLTSGAFNGVLMMGLFKLVTLAPMIWGGAALLSAGLPMMAATIAATSIFSGIMAVKRALTAEHSHTISHGQGVTPVVVPSISQGMAQQVTIAPADVAEGVQQEAPSTKWADSVGRRGDRVQEILNKPMTDQDRASAILAARETAAGQSASIG